MIKNGEINKDYMEKDAVKILADAGINVGSSIRLITFVVDSKSHPLVQHKQLMPVLPIVLVDNFDQAVAMAIRVEHGFGHTAMIHSNDIDNITTFSQALDTTTVIVNGRSQLMAVENERGGTAWTIAGATGEGCTTPGSYTRQRRLIIKEAMNFIK